MDKAVENLKRGAIFRGTGDNWDMKIKKDYMKKNVQNEDLHMFSSNLIGSRIDFKYLPNDKTKRKVSELKFEKVVPNKDHWANFA